jgi:hypothetical protein
MLAVFLSQLHLKQFNFPCSTMSLLWYAVLKEEFYLLGCNSVWSSRSSVNVCPTNKMSIVSEGLHDMTSLKVVLLMVTAVRTSDPTTLKESALAFNMSCFYIILYISHEGCWSGARSGLCEQILLVPDGHVHDILAADHELPRANGSTVTWLNASVPVQNLSR